MNAPKPFKQVLTMTAVQLKALGCCDWDRPDAEGRVLMLFPLKWYKSIPNRFPIESISGEKKTFRPGKTDNDERGGMLAYGVRVKE